MRKIYAVLALGVASVTTACTDDDTVTRNLNELPAPARAILTRQFAHTQVSYIKIDKDWFWTDTYEVRLVDGTEISFDRKGNWTEVDGKYAEIPAFFVPEPVRRQAGDLFPGEKITKIEKNRRDFEVELSNDVDLRFDRKFNIREMD